MFTRIFDSQKLSVVVALLSSTVSLSPAWAQAEQGEKSDQSAPQQQTIEDSEHAIKLRGLEERVNDLKERIFRSKARLILLRETVLNGVISGAKAVIVHRNE